MSLKLSFVLHGGFMVKLKVLELITKCNYCKREIEDGMIYFMHAVHGIVCERCEPFKDGGVSCNND